MVVRLTADNVVPDGELVSLLAAEVTGPVVVRRVGGDDPAVPYGVAGEAFTVAALREADERPSTRTTASTSHRTSARCTATTASP